MAQVRTGFNIPDSLIIKSLQRSSTFQTLAGTCTTPYGNMNSIATLPASYTALKAGLYCASSSSYANTGTICWSFTPSQPNIDINSGYSSVDCDKISFGSFKLYKCTPGCPVVGFGSSFSVTPGECYSWCMTYSGNGPACAFTDLCPYYLQSNPTLPRELSYFVGGNEDNLNVLRWLTLTEKNNHHFILESSTDAETWHQISRQDGAGNSDHPIAYSYTDRDFGKAINYYRLKQVDNKGNYKYSGIIAIDNAVKKEDAKVVRILNILGEEVDENYFGIKIFYYSDGTVQKQF